MDEDDTRARLTRREEVHAGLARLPLVDSEVLTLSFLEDLSVAEVTAVLQIPAQTVTSRLFKARRAPRAVLEGV